jgi:mRNA-degrading endonuclease RelE of RelBE toxin-antitoxin system
MQFVEKFRPICFANQLERLLVRFVKSSEHIKKHIQSITTNPLQGDRIPGFGSLHLRKSRIPLKGYNIGKSGGLRFIFMVDNPNKWVLPIALYFKGDYKTENSVQAMVKENLKSILDSL